MATAPAAAPPAGSPPALTPPAPPPVAATPPAESPPPPSPVAPPPESPPPPAVSPPPPDAPPPVVVSPPPPDVSPPPPDAVPPTVVSAPPPAGTPPPITPPTTPATPPTASPSPPPPGSSPPPPGAPENSPPAPLSSPPPPIPTTSPPAPPGEVSPPPPALRSSPPPPGSVKSPPPPKAPSPPPPASGPSSSTSGGLNTTVVVGIAVGGVIAVILIGALWIFLARRKPKQKLNYEHRVGHQQLGGPGGSNKSDASTYAMTAGRSDYLDSGEILPTSKPTPPPPYKGDGGGYGAGPRGGGGGMIPPPPQGSPSPGSTRPWFTYEELEAATNGFSRENLLGEGGFGRVYKGVVAGNQLVAVKQLTIGGGQGEREFRAEVEIISRVHHRHLVSLVGYCIADSQRLLVYDFVPNGTLEHALHGKNMPILDWPTRMKIALGAARGIGYLHEDCHPKIIHRDIKASNILLDNSYEAQVADFGLAKLASEAHTHVTTRVMGTFGYLAPEYALSGKLTDKSDVYSFGVVLLELITGKKPVDVTQAPGEESLVEWSRPLLTQALEGGDLGPVSDSALQGNYNENEMFRMVEVAAACVRHSASKRPKMGLVVRALETEGTDLNQGVKPGYSTVYSLSGESGEFDSSQYKANLRQFRKMALQGTTSEFGSEYGMTNEYGVAQSASSSEYQFDSRDHGPVPRGPQQQVRRDAYARSDTTSSSEDSRVDETRLDILDQPSPRPGMRAQPRATVGSLPLPPNRQPLGGERSKSPVPQRPGHKRRGSGSATGGRFTSAASSVFSQDYTPQPPPPPPDYGGQYSENYPESKYSTEDEGKPHVIADRLEEGR